MAKYKRKNQKKYPSWVTVLLIVIFIAYAAYNYFKENPLIITEKPSDGEIIVHSVDVGQGDCTIIASNEGNIIIDAGPGSGEDHLRAYIKSLGITEFKYAIFTHPHEDHIGGADMVVNEFKVNNVIMPNAVSNSAAFDKMLTAIENSDTEVIEAVSGSKYSVGDIKMTVLAPNSEEYESLNDYSVVVKLEYHDNSFMFTGDAEVLSENEILKKYSKAVLDCDVLKAGHHGSSTSNSKKFVSTVSPKIALIYCGVDNDYGHPHREIRKLFSDMGITMLRTDELGDISLRCNGNTIEVIE
ncbi:MAG: MBL fold metallo-hydrolase [Clostridia bacterium]|nr:MBL fold metallo-hydrolase [Clostridia bacterium]